jgi:hypothetical protein
MQDKDGEAGDVFISDAAGREYAMFAVAEIGAE